MSGEHIPGTTPAPGENNSEASPASQVTEPANTDKGGVQERINILTKKRRQAEREAAYWRGKAEATPPAEPAAPATPATPKAEDLNPDDFDSQADYLKAFAKATREEARAEIQQEETKRRTAESQAQINRSYSKGREAHDDFDEVALSPTVPVTQVMFDAAMGENLDKVLYYLGSNVEDAARIAALPPTQQIKEVGLLEAKLTAEPPAKTTTNAPAPPKTVGGGGNPPPVDETKMSRAELHAKWEKERRARAGIR